MAGAASPSGSRPTSMLARLEGSARVLAAIKLANVGLTMLAGFAVTYVFVRVLPIDEFRAFLLLVAFGNFTISAEFGLTSIVYSRLRRFWLGSGGAGSAGDFRREELGVLAVALLALIGGATLAVGLVLALGVVRTGMPLLFVIFFLTSCLNVLLLLARRTLAAIDHNLLWEGLELGRRAASLLLLLAVLVGLDLLLSITLQLVLMLLVLGGAVLLLNRRLDLRPRHWLALRVGGGHVRRHYLRDFGASVALTVSEVLAYNAPYFTIAVATREARAMLVFDFVFKMSRALSMTVRALIEAALPRLTSAFYEKRAARFRQLLRRALVIAGAAALAQGLVLIAAGKWLFAELFDGKAAIGSGELLLLLLLLLALSIVCVSVYLQAALGRFALLLRQSLPFLAGSLLSVPLALAVGGQGPFSGWFMAFYALTFCLAAALHALSLRRLLRTMEVAA